MGSVYSAGSASVQIVPDFSNAQRAIGQWFAKQGDMKVRVDPDLDNLAMARIRAEVAAQRPEMKVGIDKKHLAREMVTAVDFLTGTSMVGKALAKLFDVKPILMTNLGGAGVALGAVFGQAITNGIGGAAAMLPALTAGLAIPIGTAVLGSQGIVDAFKGLSDGDPKKLAAAMKDLAPAARDFVTQVHSLAPAFKDLRLDVQQHLFAGLGDSIRTLGEKMLPMLRGHLTGIADEIGGMGKALAGALGSSSNVADFAHTIDNVKAALHGVTAAIAPLWSVFQNLATVGSDFLPGLAKGFGDLAQKFADFIQKARDSGALHDFIASSMDGLKQVLALVLHLGSVLGSIFKAALPSGQVLLQTLDLLTGSLAKFFKTDAAQTGLTTFFHGLTEAIGGLTPGLLSLVQALVTAVLPAMSGLASAIAPIVGTLLGQFADLLRDLGPLFYPALAGAISTALGALSPLVGVFSDLARTVLPVVITAIQKLAPLFAELAEGVGEALTRAIDKLAPALPPIVDAFQAIAEVLVPFALSVFNLAVDILPPFVAVLKAVGSALQFIAPLLPALITAFVGMKVLAGINVLLVTFSERLLAAAVAAEGLGAAKLSNGLMSAAGASERAAGGFASMSKWLGPVGIVAGVAAITFGAIANAISRSDEEARNFQTSLAKLRLTASFGGDAGSDAADKLQAVRDKIAGLKADIADTSNDPKGNLVSRAGVTDYSAGQRGELERLQAALKGSRAEYQKMREELGPVGLAQAQLTLAQEAYNKAVESGSPQKVATALQGLKTAESLVAVETKKHNDAITSQLDLMKQQQDAILNAANAQLAFENAQAQAQSSLEAYNEVQKKGIDDHGAAERQLRGDILSVADAAARKAEQENVGKTATEIHKASMDAYIETLKTYSATLTGPARVAMDQMISSLEASNTAANVAKSALDEVGVSVKSIPNSHDVIINAPTAAQEKALHDLGYTTTHLPDGTVLVTVDTAGAAQEVSAFVAAMSSRTIPIKVTVIAGRITSVGGLGGGGGSVAGGAIGGIVKPMASGGINSLFMSGRVASVVKPNTWRVIGDRVTDDEAFIPINKSARSQEVLAQTAGSMGYSLLPNADGNYWTPPGMDKLYSGGFDRAMSASLRDARQRQLDGSTAAGTSVAGFVNHGTVVTTDLDELARKSRRGTQRALVAAGL